MNYRYQMNFFILLIFLLTGCVSKQYEIVESKLIVLKTPKIKFADIGYIRSIGDSIELELFSAGQVVSSITINHLICIENEGCISKSWFNEKYLNKAYPETIMKNILLGKAIFRSEMLELNNDGFEQHIVNKSVNIIYRVDSNKIYFKDRVNNILIKIKALPK